MSKQILFRVDDELKHIIDALVIARGGTQQELVEIALREYILTHIGEGETHALIPVAYEYITKHYQTIIAPLLPKMEEFQRMQAIEEAKHEELMLLYDKIIKQTSGKKLIEVLVKRLDYQEQYRAFSDIYIEYEKRMKQLFEMENDDEIIKTSIRLARIHTMQSGSEQSKPLKKEQKKMIQPPQLT